jgi:hypothetical protein
MQHFVLGCAIGGLIAAAILAPLLAPWPIRLRYLVNAPMTDPWTGLGLAPRLDMHAVVLSAIECHEGDVEISIDETGTRRTSRITLTRAGCPPVALAKLDGWLAMRTPLLMVKEHGHIYVQGPDGAVTNLTPVGERVVQ